MTLAAENIALKAENARLRKALRFYDKAYCANCHNFISSTATEALAQPTPTTPETDKAQGVIDAAYEHNKASHYGGLYLLCDCGICKAVEAYRGGA